jgi:hypothetical protein
MDFKLSAKEDLLSKMYFNMEDFRNRMVSTGTE